MCQSDKSNKPKVMVSGLSFAGLAILGIYFIAMSWIASDKLDSLECNLTPVPKIGQTNFLAQAHQLLISLAKTPNH